jgi:putative endonuclease
VDRRSVGALGEDAAAAWYEAAGYTIIARNWRVREGEIDLIARRARVLVVCEVKTRTSSTFGMPVEAITRTKQMRLRKLAGLFLAAEPQAGCSVRFDVASVMPGGAGPKVEIIEAAF